MYVRSLFVLWVFEPYRFPTIRFSETDSISVIECTSRDSSQSGSRSQLLYHVIIDNVIFKQIKYTKCSLWYIIYLKQIQVPTDSISKVFGNNVNYTHFEKHAKP